MTAGRRLHKTEADGHGPDHHRKLARFMFVDVKIRAASNNTVNPRALSLPHTITVDQSRSRAIHAGVASEAIVADKSELTTTRRQAHLHGDLIRRPT